MKNAMKFLISVMCILLITVCAPCASISPKNEDLSILFQWTGNFPVDQLARLPYKQRAAPVGYIGNGEVFSNIWQVFKPGEPLPEVDFSVNFIVFVRNVNFYNRISILKCTVHKGVAEVTAMETMSAIPIEDKVAMALALVPRAGVAFIETGKETITVR